MSQHAPIVVIGTGLAGYHLVKELRKLAPEQTVVMITADDGRNYSKPMLSTGFSKNKTADNLAMASAADMAEQLNIVVRTNTQVTHIAPSEHKLYIGEEVLEYSKLVLALGANVITPAIDGDAQDRIFSINDLQDYARFRNVADNHKRVIIMGAGLIGCEYANDMRAGGYDVDVVAPCDHLLPSLLPPVAADALQSGLEGIGVRFHLNTVINKLTHNKNGIQAELSNGCLVEADLAVSAIGLRPRLELATKAGLATGLGIKVNKELETSAKDIYAIGDCAEVEGRVLLFVLPLMASARALAKTLAGQASDVSFGVMPVTVKTPVVPVVVSPPAPGAEGNWTAEASDKDVQAEFRNQSGQLLGYALTGAKVVNKLTLNKELPPILP